MTSCQRFQPCHSISLNIHEHPCKPQRRVERCPGLLRGPASVLGVPFQLLLSPVPPPSAVPGCFENVERHHPPTFQRLHPRRPLYQHSPRSHQLPFLRRRLGQRPVPLHLFLFLRSGQLPFGPPLFAPR